MGDDESSMNIGSLIKYYSIDDEIFYGIVTEYFKNHDRHSHGPVVQVHWIEDNDVTLEVVRNLLDPDVEFINIISEN